MKGMAGLEELFREMNQKKASSGKGGHIERGLIRGNSVRNPIRILPLSISISWRVCTYGVS